ncbi:MAG: hypothetical protein ACYC7A_19120 [Thermoanaerobaculia bacterium]
MLQKSWALPLLIALAFSRRGHRRAGGTDRRPQETLRREWKLECRRLGDGGRLFVSLQLGLVERRELEFRLEQQQQFFGRLVWRRRRRRLVTVATGHSRR